MTQWPITIEDVLAARDRIRPHLPCTPLRGYATLDAAVGCGIRVLVKHENHNPTNAFKVRNGLSVMTTLTPDERRRGVVAASRGNHGMGLAWAGALLDVPVTICVPVGNNPEKNEAIVALGARLISEGRDYDEATLCADRLMREEGMRLVHSTNDAMVIAGAATMTLEILEQAPAVDAIVSSVGGGSQAVGAITVARASGRKVSVHGVQAERASTIHDSWHARRRMPAASADTFADGLATRDIYDMTFGPLCEGLESFSTVSEEEIAAALRLLLRTTHNLAEGAGAAGLAGLIKKREQLAGRTVAVILSGSNIDEATLRRVMTGGR